jgi:Flp pilus assembly protein TadG
MKRRFRLGDRRGNVALIAALCAPILMLMVGAAIDYAYALNVNQRLNQAADTAVLAAISPSIAQGAGGYPTAYSNGNMHTVAVNTFAANTTTLPVSATPSVNISKSTSSTATTYTATLTYSTSVPTFFSGLVGLASIPISGTASSTVTPLTYIRYYILIDISQSMGIGSTSNDMQNLYIRIANNGQGTGGEPGCVFGCHVAESTQNSSNENYAHNLVSYSKSGSYGTDAGGYITLRIDSAISAVNTIIQAAISNENSTSPNISVGVYTMSALSSPNIVTQVFAPTTNLSSSSVSTSLGQITLGANTPGGVGDSYLGGTSGQIAYFANNYLPAQGSGASASSPQNYVFLITDGVNDTAGNCTSGHCTSALTASDCAALKTNATVGVIYTTYLPIYNLNNSAYGYETNYANLVLPFAGSIASNLQGCASSSSYYFEASNGPAITTGMQTLFASSLQTARLTQ